MNRIKIISLLTLFCLAFSGQGQSPGNYRNPVIPGDFPDPTVIRVGKMYYASGTTSDFAPNYPVYESADLVNWKQIGSVFNEPLAWLSDSLWAPELYYKDGTFYVYYTAKRKGDRVSCIGVATTKDPRKGFIDQGIIVEWGKEAIDGFVFQDEYTIDGHFLPQWGVGIRTGLMVDGIKDRQGSYSAVKINYSFN